jgi:hypothetical protein
MNKMSLRAVTAYYPNDPKSLLDFLKQHLAGPDKTTPVFLWVDNNDHKTSSEFYTLRKLIRAGLKVQVFINPPLSSEKEVFDFLADQVEANDQD